MKQGYVNVDELAEEIMELENMPEEKLASYINGAAIGATTRIGAKEAVLWLNDLKKWALNRNA